MIRTVNRLTATKVKSLSDPGRHSDDGELYLRIRATGTKSWAFSYSDNGRRRDLGLGGFDKLTLAQARSRMSCCDDRRPLSFQRPY